MPEQQVFDLQEAQRLKTEGMQRAEKTRPEILKQARLVATMQAKLYGETTADDVYAQLENTGWNATFLGNAAGRVFSGKEWICIGWRKSTRVSNHSRSIRVWRLRA